MPDKPDNTPKSETNNNSKIPADWPQAVKDFKANSGKQVVVLTDEDTEEKIFFRRPTKPELNRAIDMMGRKKQTQAFEMLTKGCLLHPTREEAVKRFEELPALSYAWGEKLMEVVGGTKGYDAKVF